MDNQQTHFVSMPKNMLQEISQFLWIFELLILRLTSRRVRQRIDQVIQYTQGRDLVALFSAQQRKSASSSTLSASDDGLDPNGGTSQPFDLELVQNLWKQIQSDKISSIGVSDFFRNEAQGKPLTSIMGYVLERFKYPSTPLPRMLRGSEHCLLSTEFQEFLHQSLYKNPEMIAMLDFNTQSLLALPSEEILCQEIEDREEVEHLYSLRQYDMQYFGLNQPFELKSGILKQHHAIVSAIQINARTIFIQLKQIEDPEQLIIEYNKKWEYYVSSMLTFEVELKTYIAKINKLYLRHFEEDSSAPRFSIYRMMCILWYKEVLAKGIMNTFLTQIKLHLRLILDEGKPGIHFQQLLQSMIDLSIQESSVHFLSSSQLKLGSIFTQFQSKVDDLIKDRIKAQIKKKIDPIELTKKITSLEKLLSGLLPKISKRKMFTTTLNHIKEYFKFYLRNLLKSFMKVNFKESFSLVDDVTTIEQKVKDNFGKKKVQSLLMRVLEKEEASGLSKGKVFSFLDYLATTENNLLVSYDSEVSKKEKNLILIENYDKVIRKHKAKKGILLREIQEPSPFSLVHIKPSAGGRRNFPKRLSFFANFEESKDFNFQRDASKSTCVFDFLKEKFPLFNPLATRKNSCSMRETRMQMMKRHNILLRVPKKRVSLPLMNCLTEDSKDDIFSTHESSETQAVACSLKRVSHEGVNLVDLMLFELDSKKNTPLVRKHRPPERGNSCLWPRSKLLPSFDQAEECLDKEVL